MSSLLPEWLLEANTKDHLDFVLETLTKRECKRANACAASRHAAHPSKAHRASLGSTATLFKDPDFIDYYSIKAGTQPENQRRNRYADVVPYDRTRVVVGEGGDGELGKGGKLGKGRYLNANWVRELFGGKWWIATQAPLPSTTHVFLSMIAQPITRPPPTLLKTKSAVGQDDGCTSRVRTVVQLTRNFESGRPKAHLYFPPVVGQSWVAEPEAGCSSPSLKVTLVGTKEFLEAHCVQSTVSIIPVPRKDSDQVAMNPEPIVFQHLLFAAWPDHGVPEREDREALLNFARLVDRTNKDLSPFPTSIHSSLDPDPPIMVNCSAGIGRSGSFIAISSLLRAHGLLDSSSSSSPSTTAITAEPLCPSPLGPLPEDIMDDLVAREVDALRDQRPGMVQRPEQIFLIYEVLAAALMRAARK